MVEFYLNVRCSRALEKIKDRLLQTSRVQVCNTRFQKNNFSCVGSGLIFLSESVPSVNTRGKIVLSELVGFGLLLEIHN